MSACRSFTRWLAILPWIGVACSRTSPPDPGADAAPGASTTASAAPSSSSSAAPLASAALTVAVGAASAPPPYMAPSSGPRLGALSWETQVRERPSENAKSIGYLRAGAVVALKSAEPAGKDGCPRGGWYEIEPRGFVCADPSNATTELDHELLRALQRRPDPAAAMPYLYGIVRKGAPIYGRLPSLKQAAEAEPDLDAHRKEWLAAEGENGASFRADYWLQGKTAPPAAELMERRETREIPWFFQDRAPPGNLSGFRPGDGLVLARAKHHNGFAFVDTAVLEGRRYAISTQLFAIPVDRLRPIEGSSFHGVEIPRDIDFPFAFVRRAGPLHRLENGKLSKVQDAERRAVLKLTGKQKKIGERLYYETADHLWISDQHASRLDPAKKMPKWGKKGERWLDVNITKQTLVAYDGTRPVYATLVSTGEAGLDDPETSRATKRGIFRVHAKHVSATMDSDIVGEEFELRDIPYVQYFEGGYALHAAYWHDDFGKPRSHGCINLAPLDARRLFFFTEPAVPDGWHGARKALTGSVVFVHP
jgi:hypothetical protein